VSAESPAVGRPERVSRLVLWLMAVTFLIKLLPTWRFEGFLTEDDLEVVQTAAKYAMGSRLASGYRGRLCPALG